MAASSLALAQQHWDGPGPADDGIVQGGSGVWDELNGNWTDATGAENTFWMGDIAVFGGLAAGTVSVSGEIEARTLSFQRSGYLLNRAPGPVSIIDASTVGLFVFCDSGVTATIDVPIDARRGASRFQAFGPGTLVFTSSLSVGSLEHDAGAFRLQDGAFVIGVSGFINSRITPQNPIMTVSGAGTLWHMNGDLFVGEEGFLEGGGKGTLIIQSGAVVENDQYGLIGYAANGVGLVTVHGAGSMWTVSSDLRVGEAGDGTLIVSGGGSVSTGFNGYVARQEGSIGEATVTGAGSRWTMPGFLEVGGVGQGMLNVQTGGLVRVHDVTVGFLPESSGTVTVDGVGARLEVSTDLNVHSTGTLMVANEGVVTAAEVHLASGATLGGNGRIVGPVGNGGVVGPGLSPGRLTVEGNYTQEADGLLRIEIGGTAPALFDHLTVLGDVSLLSDSVLELVFIDGFAPKRGDRFNFLTSSGQLIGEFSEIRITGLQPGFQYMVESDDPGNLEVTALNDGVAAPPPNANADLAIAKTAEPSSLSARETLTYTLTAANSGPNAASAVVVRDNLPASVTYVSGSATGGGQVSAAGNSITVNFATLAANASATITLTTRVNSNVPNNTTIANTASVSATTADPNRANNSATVTTLVLNPHTLKFYLHGNDIPGTAGGFTMNQTPARSQTLALNLLTSPRWFSEPALNGTFRAAATFKVVITRTAGLSLATTYRLSATNADGTGEQLLGQTSKLLAGGTQTITIPVTIPITLANKRLKLTISSAVGLGINLQMGNNTYLEATQFVGTP
jgi:uncharacterized repeat protein (TIGR01451 family)